jgi:hypothetical protein
VDFCRLPGVIFRISKHKDTYHHILTVFGVLADKYLTSDLEPYSGVISVDLEAPTESIKIISLHEAAKLQSARTGSVEQINAICNCMGTCSNDKRCSCFKIGKKCTSHCHNKQNKNGKKNAKFNCCNVSE